MKLDFHRKPLHPLADSMVYCAPQHFLLNNTNTQEKKIKERMRNTYKIPKHQTQNPQLHCTYTHTLYFYNFFYIKLALFIFLFYITIKLLNYLTCWLKLFGNILKFATWFTLYRSNHVHISLTLYDTVRSNHTQQKKLQLRRQR